MKKTKKKEAAKKAIEALKQRYPDAVCSLEYGDALQLYLPVCRPNAPTPGLIW